MVMALFLAARIVANPISNVFQKQLVQKSADPVFIIGATHGLLTAVCLPLLLGLLPLDILDMEESFWASITIAALLAVFGNVLLVYALRSADLSLLGPINAYKSVISLVPGVFLIGEVPTRMGATGIFLILAGSYIVVDRRVDQPRSNAFVQFFRERGVQLRFAALVLSATEAVFLKRALLVSSPLTTFVLWSILGLPIASVVLLVRERLQEELRLLRKSARTYLWLAMATGVMQLATLFTFGRLQVGYSLALFQLSTPISVFLGYRYFQERNIRKRLFGSAVMAAGAMLIVVFGRPG
jgi:drug/metabolite transporter (DMT)-like permease